MTPPRRTHFSELPEKPGREWARREDVPPLRQLPNAWYLVKSTSKKAMDNKRRSLRDYLARRTRGKD